MHRGAIAYSPGEAEVLTFPPFRFYFLPGREARPRDPNARAGPPGLHRPHRPCPFDADDFLAEREVLRVARGGRSYHIALNRFPVLKLHHLAIRPSSEAEVTLPQRLGGAEEIEDMLRLAALLGPPYRLFFNSNQGADGSRSGSSVNHWHFQIFPSDFGAVWRATRTTSGAGPVERGAISDWPARHRLYRSRDGEALATALWADVRAVVALDRAYNVEILALGEGDLLALLFPRSPVGDLSLPDGNVLSGDFGGFELTGGVVVPGRSIFQWVQSHPREAVRRMIERIREGTSEPPP